MPDTTSKGALPELSERYAELDNVYNSLVTFSNQMGISVTGFLVFNDCTNSDRFNPEKNFILNYNKDIEELKIDEKLFQFGTSGSMVLVDEQGKYSFLMEDYNFYHLVINIYENVTEDGKRVKLEPYILHITSVEPITPPGEKNKKLLVKFVDIISYEAMTHQFASLLKFDTSYKECTCYRDAFQRAIQYLLDMIQLNGKNSFEYRKEFKFHDDYSTNDSTLLKLTFEKLEEHSTLYELLNTLTKDACIAIKPDGSQTANFEDIGDVRIPMFCCQEPADYMLGYYAKFPTNNDNVFRVVNMGGKETAYFHRPFVFRDFYMPFKMGFDDGLIYEAINPGCDEEEQANVGCMMGSSDVPLKGLDVLPANAQSVSNRWKNMIFMACEGGQASSRLIFFNWMYEYFNQIFVGGRLNTGRDKFSNIIPPFYFLEKNMDTSGADFQTFSEINSNVFPLRTTEGDPVVEILMEMGKTIASFVFLNTSYSFTIPGNILRHPNEIIKVSRGTSFLEQADVSFFTDYAFSEYVYLYVSQVSHYFHGLDYDNVIVCNRIYERETN